MANEIKTTLHPMGDTGTNLYPNIKSDNLPDNLEFSNAQVPSTNNIKPYLLLEDNDGKVYKTLYSIAFTNFNIPSKIENNTYSGVNTFNNTTYLNGNTFHDETATFNDVVINGEVDFNSDITFSVDITFGNQVTFNDDVTISDTGVFKNYAQTQILGSLYLGSDAKQTLVNLIYPVGSIYMSVNDVSPSTLFGGTWVKLEDRFLLGSGNTYTNGDTGGNATHSHNYKIRYTSFYDSIVSFNSGDDNIQCASYDSSNNITWNSKITGTKNVGTYKNNGIQGGSGLTDDTNISIVDGTTDYQSSLPPYLVVNMWKRTA